jgi:hypothetical protein
VMNSVMSARHALIYSLPVGLRARREGFVQAVKSLLSGPNEAHNRVPLLTTLELKEEGAT